MSRVLFTLWPFTRRLLPQMSIAFALCDRGQDQLADLDALPRRCRPDVIATDVSLWGPIVLLHESQPGPVALSSTFMGPLIPGPDAPPWGFGLRPPRAPWQRALARALTYLTKLARTGLRGRVDEIRAEHGLPPLGVSVNRYAARLPLYLPGNIRELDYDRQDLPRLAPALATEMEVR
jgi:hypothetical protein